MALSAPLTPVLSTPPPPDAPRRLWTRDEYYRMAEVGLLDSDERVELLDGELFIMPPQLTPHASSVYFHNRSPVRPLWRGLCRGVPSCPSRSARARNPNRMCAWHSGTGVDFADHHPGPSEIVLVVEVSDSTLQKDRTRKAAAYARAGIDEYWIVNVTGRQVEVYRGPDTNGAYADVQTLGPGDVILPLSAGPDAVPVRVQELLIPSPESER